MFIVFILSFKTFISSVYLVTAIAMPLSMTISLELLEFRYLCDWICGFSFQGRRLASSMNEKDIILYVCIYVYMYVYVTPPTRVRTNSPSGSRTRDSGAGGGRSNKERQRLQPLASVARAPHFEVRRVRFTHSPYWHTSVTLTPLNLTPALPTTPM